MGGWPQLRWRPAPPDTDGDETPDEWEIRQRLDPHDVADGSKDHDGNGYTNVEEHINGTDPTVFVDYKKRENDLDTP